MDLKQFEQAMAVCEELAGLAALLAEIDGLYRDDATMWPCRENCIKAIIEIGQRIREEESV